MTRETAHCTFCDLMRGAAEVSICHEDADAIAFMDIQPVNNGHVLVVPREHYESLHGIPQELGLHLFKVTMRLADAVMSVSGCPDLNIVVSSGEAA
ncbi:MAG TPA: HIT domain-containing protein, partial [Gemmatimonadaceae bacterium]